MASRDRTVRCLLAAALLLGGCAPRRGRGPVVITVAASAVGDEGVVLRRQVARFERANPGVAVRIRMTPDAADQRHQLYVQWLGAGTGDPDVLQIDVIWTPELAAAGWILPLDRFGPDAADFFPEVLRADRFQGRLYAVPWFVDVGMLYWRTDLLARPPGTFAELSADVARMRRAGKVRDGLATQAARYEGLVTFFQEVLGGFGGRILGPGGTVEVASPAGHRALSWLTRALANRTIPRAALTWHEEPARFDFQNGDALFLRNWPYAYKLMNDPRHSKVAGRFAVAPMPAAPGGTPTAALGGSQLAVNADTRHPRLSWRLVRFLTAPAQMLERARIAGELPARVGLYADPRLAAALPIPPAQAKAVIARARPRPVTPVYPALSAALQIHLNRALTGQETVDQALRAAAAKMRRILAETRAPPAEAVPAAAARGGGARAPAAPARARTTPSDLGALRLIALGLLAALAVALGLSRRAPRGSDARAAVGLLAPAVAVIVAIALFPLGQTVWLSLHRHDLRMPWQGHPFVGLANFAAAFHSGRFLGALAHTLVFTGLAVTLELFLGLALALLLDQGLRGRGLLRATSLVPWALPTVVAGLLFRYLFAADSGVVNAIAMKVHLFAHPVVWLGDAVLAWVPVVLADAWKTTPFVALILLAGLAGIDEGLYESARMDGAGPVARFFHVTLPLLRPAIAIAVLFRALDALRVFGLIYVLTGGGPGTATEPIALTTWAALLQDLRLGYGSALAVLVFLVTAAVATLLLTTLGRDLTHPLS